MGEFNITQPLLRNTQWPF